jgi:antitoxin (DNA-binding transcriptional repressor) of toxin-antitoxin stability system
MMTMYRGDTDMQRIPAGKFKAQCLTLTEGVRATRELVPITKPGKPVAKLVPAEEPADDFIGRLKGVTEIVGDIESPIEPPGAWESARWSCSIRTC